MSDRDVKFSGAELALWMVLILVDFLGVGYFLRMLWVVNYFRWVWVRISSCMNGSRSQYVVFKKRSLIPLVTSIMADVVMRAGLPVESYVKPR